MRLVSYSLDGTVHLGALVGDQIADLHKACSAARLDVELPTEMTEFVRAGEPALAAAREAVGHVESLQAAAADREAVCLPRASATLLPPLPRPPKFVCVARNYAEHAREAGLELPTMPILFPRFNNTLVGDGGEIVVPSVSHEVDWEGELAVVVGRDTHGRIGRDEAMEYVYGYSIFNDITVRDFQFRVTQYTAGKNFRASGPFGPTLVTADEVPDPHAVDITTRLNGQVMQQANTSTMIFDIPTILEHIAEFVDLEAGDVIATGTPAGVGFKRKPPIFLKPGDTIEVSIDGIGILSNPVVGEN